jgi:hypothetical protein
MHVPFAVHVASPCSAASARAGGTGERYPTTSSSAPTTRNVAILVPVEELRQVDEEAA